MNFRPTTIINSGRFRRKVSEEKTTLFKYGQMYTSNVISNVY